MNIFLQLSLEFVRLIQDLLYKDKARKLEEETRAAIYSENEDFLTILELIDDIQRLGLAFRFEKDIKRVLDRFVDSEGRNLWTQKSLHATSLMFRLLRQHGYEVSQGIIIVWENYYLAPIVWRNSLVDLLIFKNALKRS